MPCHVWTALSLTDTLALYKKSTTTKVSLCNGSSSLQCFGSRRALLIPATSPVHGKTAKGGRRLKEPRIAWSRTRPFMFALYKPYQRYCIYLLLPIWGGTKSTKYTKHICSYLFGKRHVNKIYRSYFLLHVHAVCANPRTYHSYLFKLYFSQETSYILNVTKPVVVF